MVHSSEKEQLQLQVSDLNTQSQLLKAENEAEMRELKSKVELYESQIENNTITVLQGKEQFEMQLVKEEEVARRLMVENHDLQSELSKSRLKINSLEHVNSSLEMHNAAKSASVKRKDSIIEAKTRALQQKDAIISGMSEKLTRAREYLATKQQVSSKL